MNKRHLLTGFMFLLCTCTAFAQQVEVKKDSIGRAVLLPPEQKQPLNMAHWFTVWRKQTMMRIYLTVS